MSKLGDTSEVFGGVTATWAIERARTVGLQNTIAELEALYKRSFSTTEDAHEAGYIQGVAHMLRRMEEVKGVLVA